jgi:hypothetical protein
MQVVGTGQTRFGPLPSPESLVAIRDHLRRRIADRDPIRLLVPWGSKKPTNTATVDLAEPRVTRCSMATVGGRPVSESMSGFGSCSTNWRA